MYTGAAPAFTPYKSVLEWFEAVSSTLKTFAAFSQEMEHLHIWLSALYISFRNEHHLVAHQTPGATTLKGHFKQIEKLRDVQSRDLLGTVLGIHSVPYTRTIQEITRSLQGLHQVLSGAVIAKYGELEAKDMSGSSSPRTKTELCDTVNKLSRKILARLAESIRALSSIRKLSSEMLLADTPHTSVQIPDQRNRIRTASLVLHEAVSSVLKTSGAYQAPDRSAPVLLQRHADSSAVSLRLQMDNVHKAGSQYFLRVDPCYQIYCQHLSCKECYHRPDGEEAMTLGICHSGRASHEETIAIHVAEEHNSQQNSFEYGGLEPACRHKIRKDDVEPCPRHIINLSKNTLLVARNVVDLYSLLVTYQADPARLRIMDRLQLACNLAILVLDLCDTPWLSENWSLSEVALGEKTSAVPWNLDVILPADQVFKCIGHTTHTCTGTKRNEGLQQHTCISKSQSSLRTVFNLGIALLEIAYVRPMSFLRQGSRTEPKTFERILTWQNPLGLTYQKVVERCFQMGMRPTSGVEDIRRAVYTHVVSVLRDMIQFISQ